MLAVAIVAANFALMLQLTGLAYGRYQWTVLALNSYITPTATPTATATPTNTPVPNGGSCMAGSQCSSTFCVDGVCCDRACDQVGDFCNLPGSEGICTIPAAGAPTLQVPWLVVAVLLLMAVALLGFRREAVKRGEP